MPLCININVNNSDMSIKNERIGTKKYVKAINVRNLNHMTDRQQMMDEKRASARKQAIKLISDAWKSDNKATDNINVMDKAKETIAIRNNELMSKLKDIKDSQEALREQYGVDKDSEEQNDLELLIKYQDNKTGIFSDKFSKEEIERLKELQSQPLTEYQKKSLMINAGKDSVYNELDRNETKAMSLTMSINDAKTEQLKSQDMLKAQDAADSILEAAEKDIYGSLINEGKNNIDDKQQEDKEKAEEAQEKKEEREEQTDKVKEKRKEEQAIIEGETESDILNTFFGAMHNKDREELETIFSNEFLEDPEAVKNMDKFIERYTPSYSNLLAAWEVNDTICIQLRRFDAFICLHFDNKQTDKISSIRVFDSTTEDEESISQYDFNQDEMGIYFPD